MDKLYEKIWQLALPHFKKGRERDIKHTEGVVKAMKLLLKKEGGQEDLLIPAAILHDIGWSKVPLELKEATDDEGRKKALQLHIEYAAPIIREILGQLGYDGAKIKEIIDIVQSHKFQDPKEINKQLLIDADTVPDAFKEQFYVDVSYYKKTPKEIYDFRKNNKFYTKTAKAIFDKELEERKKEFLSCSK